MQRVQLPKPPITSLLLCSPHTLRRRQGASSAQAKQAICFVYKLIAYGKVKKNHCNTNFLQPTSDSK